MIADRDVRAGDWLEVRVEEGLSRRRIDPVLQGRSARHSTPLEIAHVGDSSPLKRVDYRPPIYQYSTVTRKTRPLPSASLHIVLALLDGEAHGYALMGRVTDLSDGVVRMGPGTLYGTLNRLVEDGLIEETTDRARRDDSERRRYYQLTPNGRAVAQDEIDRLQGLVHRFATHLRGGATA
jgi:DNA-binding PadR family transcriptional regulator